MPVSVIFPSERDHVVVFSFKLGSVNIAPLGFCGFSPLGTSPLGRNIATGNIATGKSDPYKRTKIKMSERGSTDERGSQ